MIIKNVPLSIAKLKLWSIRRPSDRVFVGLALALIWDFGDRASAGLTFICALSLVATNVIFCVINLIIEGANRKPQQ